VSDESALANALREAEEEIGLSPDRIRVLGRLGDYVTHSGFRIAPFVGLVEPPLSLEARAGEVEAILEIPLSIVLRSDSYQLRGWKDSQRAHFFLPHADIIVTGPTVSIMMGLYEALLETQSDLEGGRQ
jgi:8-oxo-dGTP pyrophosphatase MutT (NUDIX family)